MVKLDSNLVDSLTEEQVSELRKRINPYGRTIEGSDKYTCASVVNLSEQYMQKLLMTSLIGFLFRQCDEYKLDDGEPPIHMDDFNKFMKVYNEAVEAAINSRVWLQQFNIKKEDKADTELSISEKAQCLEHQRIVERGDGFKRRLIIRQFLGDLFQFNPDNHVRSAYSDNPLDPERVQPAHVERKIVKKIVGKSGNVMEIQKNTQTADVPDIKSDEKKKRSESEFVKHIPPADTFHRWKYYLESNY